MKQTTGLLLATALVAVNAFAMEMSATGTTMVSATGTMMKDDHMMATGTKMMEHMDKKMDKMVEKMEDKKMLTEAEALKINSLSGKAKIEALQLMLIEKGYLKVPKGTKLGFYGAMTKKAHLKMKGMMMKMDAKMMKDDKMMHEDKMMGTSSTSTMMHQ